MLHELSRRELLALKEIRLTGQTNDQIMALKLFNDGMIFQVLVPPHRGFDRLSVVHRRSGRCSGSTSNSILRAILGFLLMNPSRSSVNTIW